MARRSGSSLTTKNGTLANSAGTSSGEPCANADLFFLKDTLARGLSFVQVAGFLCRPVDEVWEKAKELNTCVSAEVHTLNRQEQPGSAGRKVRSREREMVTAAAKNRIMIYGPKDDGTYVVEFRTAAGDALAVPIPMTKAGVIRHFQERMPYGLFVPDVP